MRRNYYLPAVLCLSLAMGIVGCSGTSTAGTDPSSSGSEVIETTDEASETEDAATDEAVAEEEPEEPESQPISLGQNVQSDDFSITLTDARVDSVLQSDASTIYWEPQDGTAFVILEFDITALNSNQLPVDDYAVTDLCANYNGDTYQGWRLQYITNQLWLSFTHTYLDANIPTHIYAYTAVPSAALNEGSLSVDMTLDGTLYNVTIH